MEKTCLHRFLGECKGCVRDYEPRTINHPVNNCDCKNYYEIHFLTYEIAEQEIPFPSWLPKRGKNAI